MKSLIAVFTITLFSSYSFSQCYSAGENLPSTGYIVQTSGYRDLDSIVVSEILKLENFFGVNVDFFFLLETYSKNAMYTPSCNSFCNGTVFLGIKMLYSQLQKKHGVECVKAILAHEFGHCVQHLMNWKELGKRPELHSDFMAGYYTGRMYNYTDEQMSSLFTEFFSMGDNQYWDSQHHGTHAERECAFLEGYYFAKENNTTVVAANNYAVQYVVADNPCGIRKYYYFKSLLEKDEVQGNIGSIQIVATDKNMYYISMKSFEGRDYGGVFNHRNRSLVFNKVACSFRYDFNLYKRSLIAGDILMGTITINPKKGKTSEVVIHGNSIYFGDNIIQDRLRIENLRQSYNWIGSLGLSLQPLPIGLPISLYLERKFGQQGLSVRGNVQFRSKRNMESDSNLDPYNYFTLGGDLKKSLRIPFCHYPFIGPTLSFTRLKVKDPSYPIQNESQFYLGARIGGGRDLFSRFFWGWDFSLGYRKQFVGAEKGGYFDVNTQIGMRF
jgi:hypothetical protein